MVSVRGSATVLCIVKWLQQMVPKISMSLSKSRTSWWSCSWSFGVIYKSLNIIRVLASNCTHEAYVVVVVVVIGLVRRLGGSQELTVRGQCIQLWTWWLSHVIGLHMRLFFHVHEATLPEARLLYRSQPKPYVELLVLCLCANYTHTVLNRYEVCSRSNYGWLSNAI